MLHKNLPLVLPFHVEGEEHFGESVNYDKVKDMNFIHACMKGTSLLLHPIIYSSSPFNIHHHSISPLIPIFHPFDLTSLPTAW